MALAFARRNDALSKQMKSFLRTKSGLFPGEQGDNAGVEKRYWNTNQVESLFARVKQTVHVLRSLPNNPYIHARLTPLRWWLNIQEPLSGINRNNPPIVRCGGQTASLCVCGSGITEGALVLMCVRSFPLRREKRNGKI